MAGILKMACLFCVDIFYFHPLLLFSNKIWNYKNNVLLLWCTNIVVH
jgi:hypothetical protein